MDGQTGAAAVFGVLSIGLGIYGLSRRRLSINLGRKNRRYRRFILRLRGGPAVLVGLSALATGLLFCGSLLSAWIVSGSASFDDVPGASLLVLVLGLLLGAGWQILRNLRRFWHSDEVQHRLHEGIREARRKHDESR